MDKKTSIDQPVDIEKKNGDVEKKAPDYAENSDNLAILLAEIIVENLVRKYRGKYSKLSFKDASEAPDRLKKK